MAGVLLLEWDAGLLDLPLGCKPEDDPAPPLAEVGVDGWLATCTMDVENEEIDVEVTIDWVGANAMPLLVGVTVSSDTKSIEVMRTVV